MEKDKELSGLMENNHRNIRLYIILHLIVEYTPKSSQISKNELLSLSVFKFG